MKKHLVFAVMLLIASMCLAQRSVTKFMGVPVDGTKKEMIKKLEKKGFIYDSETGMLFGKYEGKDVYVTIHMKRKVVWKVGMSFVKSYDRYEAKKEFNEMCRWFERKPTGYVSLFGNRSQEIPEDEDIYYESLSRGKQYQAAYLQDGDDAKFVWFVLDEQYGRFVLTVYFENSYNGTGEEDL